MTVTQIIKQISVALGLLVTPSLLYAAYLEQQAPKADTLKNGGAYNVHFSQSYERSVIEWTVEDIPLPSIWDGWKYDLDVPQYLTTSSGTTFYGFGIWKPEEYQGLSFKESSTEDWIMNHGLNFSFSTESKISDARYRFDMRWHEDSDTEFLLQMQLPFN
ncbi:hypothetical protein A1OK_20875 [Enterovibrio norvegicus FF-454]|uniref:Uncharacterized protein n=1 Tax=Enterovibrio norvegicus FF-454 TaxID=1185651 RepID=A0A1E5CC07_9GAMM|nr:hypothetical protein A1OK_20875 [Enterovibrio norvegicus FF-454]